MPILNRSECVGQNVDYRSSGNLSLVWSLVGTSFVVRSPIRPSSRAVNGAPEIDEDGRRETILLCFICVRPRCWINDDLLIAALRVSGFPSQLIEAVSVGMSGFRGAVEISIS